MRMDLVNIDVVTDMNNVDFEELFKKVSAYREARQRYYTQFSVSPEAAFIAAETRRLCMNAAWGMVKKMSVKYGHIFKYDQELEDVQTKVGAQNAALAALMEEMNKIREAASAAKVV